MFYYLDGTVAEILPGLAVIDCGGVGYACMTTNNTLSQLKKGEKKKLYTYLNVRAASSTPECPAEGRARSLRPGPPGCRRQSRRTGPFSRAKKQWIPPGLQ